MIKYIGMLKYSGMLKLINTILVRVNLLMIKTKICPTMNYFCFLSRHGSNYLEYFFSHIFIFITFSLYLTQKPVHTMNNQLKKTIGNNIVTKIEHHIVILLWSCKCYGMYILIDSKCINIV